MERRGRGSGGLSRWFYETGTRFAPLAMSENCAGSGKNASGSVFRATVNELNKVIKLFA